MIIVNILGGLGNQMFQYACARSLAEDHNDELYLDISGFKRYNLWPYKLNRFRLSRCRYLNNRLYSYFFAMCKIFSKYLPFLSKRYVYEKNLLFNPEILDKKTKIIYLDGYFQCEKYFQHNSEKIRSEFEIIFPQSEINRYWNDKINRTNSVCLHIRRGDYISDATAKTVHGVLIGDSGLEYYRKAINYISENVKNPVFYVFSDDIQWARENLDINYETCYMDQNTSETEYEDLRLMMSCKHFIIANSSFSWWGAWLSKNPDKIVVAPKKWFVDPNKMIDIICDSWITF